MLGFQGRRHVLIAGLVELDAGQDDGAGDRSPPRVLLDSAAAAGGASLPIERAVSRACQRPRPPPAVYGQSPGVTTYLATDRRTRPRSLD
jgi:hypothetical protein